MFKKIARMTGRALEILRQESFGSLMAKASGRIGEKLRSALKIRPARMPEITKEMKLSIGVVIPCKNHGQYLGEAVDSVYANKTNVIISTVIVNDGSTDDTEKISMALKDKYPGVQYVSHAISRGLPAARNAGISALDTGCILCLDADDKIPDNYIQASCELLHACDVAYADSQCFGMSDYRYNFPEFSPAIFRHGNFVNCSSVYRRSMWEELKGYDESMTLGWEDYEFWIRAYLAGFKFCKNRETVLYYRKRETSLYTTTSNNAAKIQAYLKGKFPGFFLGQK